MDSSNSEYIPNCLSSKGGKTNLWHLNSGQRSTKIFIPEEERVEEEVHKVFDVSTDVLPEESALLLAAIMLKNIQSMRELYPKLRHMTLLKIL